MKQQADSEIHIPEQSAGRPRVNPRVARDRTISANNDPWAVVPPKKAASKKRMALRIALIVAAVGAVTAGAVVLFGETIIETIIGDLHEEPGSTYGGDLIPVPRPEKPGATFTD